MMNSRIITSKSILYRSIKAGYISFAILMIISIIGATITGITPLLFGKTLNDMLVSNSEVAISFSRVRLLLLLGILALLVQGVSTIAKKIYNRSFLRYWVSIMVTKLATANYSVLTELDTGNLNRRITKELDTLSSLFNEHIGNALSSVIVLIFAIYMLIRMSAVLTGIILIGVVIMIPIGIVVMKIVKKLMKKVVDEWSIYEGVTTDYIASQYQIRAYKAELRMIEYIIERLHKAINIDLRNAIKYMAIMLMYICLIMVLLIGFLKYIENSPSVSGIQAGSIVAFLGYLWIVAAKITSISNLTGKMQISVVVMDRMLVFLQLPDSNKSIIQKYVDSTNKNYVKSIDVQNLCVSIDNNLVISNLSFSARSSDVVLFKGRSGCGKTTLLRTLFGFTEYTCGKILVNGRDVLNIGTIGDNVVMLPQEIRLLSGPLKWNIEILTGRKIDDSELTLLLDKLQLNHRITSDMINDIDIRETGSNLSGGEKQRIALAAILLRKPDIILLDEPTAHVDKESEQIIIELIKSLALSNTIVLISSHSDELNCIASRVITLEKYCSTT